MSVELIQRAKNIRVNIIVDGTSILDEYAKAIASIASQRASGLADRESSDGNGGITKTPLTPAQISSVNQTHDAMIASAKRALQVKMLDAAKKELSASIEAAAFGIDLSSERATRKAKIDSEIDTVQSKIPTVDVDAIKA